MPLAGFEPTIPASERPQTHALDRAATGIDKVLLISSIYVTCFGRTDHPQAFEHVIKYIRTDIEYEPQ